MQNIENDEKLYVSVPNEPQTDRGSSFLKSTHLNRLVKTGIKIISEKFYGETVEFEKFENKKIF